MKYFYKDVGATKYMQSDTLIFNEAANGTITVNPLPKSAALPNSIKSLIVSYDQTFFTEAA